jgi:hypothetical protein
MAKETKCTGIRSKTRQQLEELQNTLQQFTHIEEVHFTAKGDHFFNVHEFLEVNRAGKNMGKATGKFYGRFKIEDHEYKRVGERRFYRKVRVHTPEALIIEKLSREEVLAYEYDGPEEQVKSASGITSTTADPTIAELLRQLSEMRTEMAQMRTAPESVPTKGKKAVEA